MTETPENVVIEESGYQDHPVPAAHPPAEDIEQKPEKTDVQTQIDALREQASAALANGDQNKLKEINAQKRALLAQL